MVFAASGPRSDEATAGAAKLVRSPAKANLTIRAFRDGFFPYNGAAIKEIFEEIAEEFSPDIVFTHFRDDRHQDHRVISDLTWNTFRDHLILEYEIPKYDGDFSSPNVYVSLSEEQCRNKIDVIVGTFLTQKSKPWFTEDTFWSLLRLRGVECASRFAEGFYCRKMMW